MADACRWLDGRSGGIIMGEASPAFRPSYASICPFIRHVRPSVRLLLIVLAVSLLLHQQQRYREEKGSSEQKERQGLKFVRWSNKMYSCIGTATTLALDHLACSRVSESRTKCTMLEPRLVYVNNSCATGDRMAASMYACTFAHPYMLCR
jgi:hypothetical protein